MLNTKEKLLRSLIYGQFSRFAVPYPNTAHMSPRWGFKTYYSTPIRSGSEQVGLCEQDALPTGVRCRLG